MLAKRSHACIYPAVCRSAGSSKIQKMQKFWIFSLVGPCCYPPEVGLLVYGPDYGPMVYRVQNRPPLLHGLIDSLECCNHLWAHVDELEPSDVVDLNALRRSLEIREGFNWTFFDERPSSSTAPLGNLRMLALGLKATCHRHANCSMMISSHKGVDKITASMHLHRNSHSEKFCSCQSACHSMCSCI